MLAGLEPEPAGLHAHQLGSGVDEAGEGPDRVRAPADARDHEVGVVAAEQRSALLTCFVTDHPLELAHHPRVRVGPDHGSDAVVRRLHRRHPVAQRLVDRVLERGAPAGDRHDVGPEELHAEHVQRLSFDVDRAHEHEAVEPEQRGGGRGGDAVLTGAGLGDDPLLAHPPGEQRLPEHVVDLVRAGVGEVFALQQDPQPETLRQPVALGDRRRAGPA